MRLQPDIDTGLFQLDMYMPETKRCIEIDGPVHFYGLSKHELSKTVLKNKMLKDLGLSVTRIKHFENPTPSAAELTNLIEQSKEGSMAPQNAFTDLLLNS